MTAKRRGGDLLAAGLYACLAALIGLRAIRSWDIWWHLETGKLAVTRWSTLPVDEFSLTHPGAPWRYKDLGADVVFTLLHDALGEWGLALFKLVVALAVALLLAALLRRRGLGGWLLWAVAAWAVLVVSFRVIVRPEGFTLALFPLALLGVEACRQRLAARPDRAPARLLAALVALQLLWSNLHRGALLGLVLLWGLALYVLLCRLWPRRWLWLSRRLGGSTRPSWRWVGSAGLTALLATLATGLNPSGLHLFSQALAVTRSQAVAEVISEWKALGLGELWASFPLAVAWMVAVAVAVAVAALWRGGGRVTVWDVGICVLFLWWGTRAARMLPIMALATAPSLGAAIRELVPPVSGRLNSVLAPLGVVVLLALGWTEERVEPPEPGWAEDWYPEAAVALIRDAPVVGQGHTTYTYAGYVLYHLWPEKKVLCDGRFDTVYPEETILGCLAMAEQPALFRTMAGRLQLQWVLDHNRPGPSRRPDRPRGFDYLDVDPAWTLVHWDAVSLLYVRTDGPNAALARRLGYGFLRPHDPVVSLMQAVQLTRGAPLLRLALAREVGRVQAAAPRDYRSYVLMVLFLAATGQRDTPAFEAAVRVLGEMREADPRAVDRVLEWVQ